MALSLLFTFAVVAGANAATIGSVSDLHIVNANIAPDGFTRSAVLAGGTFPGPLIAANKGDNFAINVINDLTDNTMRKSTSIHWHGMLQHGTNWADGGAMVNQCPIAPGHSFEYQFSSSTLTGTYWYHSHLSTQYCDGLRGPIVIYDPNDPHASRYDVDNEDTVITLSDWYHSVAPQQPLPAVPQSTLINGKGRWKNNPTADLSVIKVTKGKRYRFRLVSLSCDPNYTFSIDGHKLTVIEVDGVNHEPVTVDSLQIFAGQRYSVVVEAKQDGGSFWIRANPNLGDTGFANGINSAILRYDNAAISDPTSNSPSNPVKLAETDLHALNNPGGAPGGHNINGADVDMTLAFGFNSQGKFTINGTSFVPPSVPVLLQILSGAQNAQDLLPSGSVFTLPPNKVIQLRMPAGSVGGIGGPHPFHLHGHTFAVVRSAGTTSYNWENPPVRDVVSTGVNGDEVTIRFRTDNPGPWFLHCHIDWHLETGFAMVFAEDPKDTALANPVPSSWSDLCPIYDALDPADQKRRAFIRGSTF